MVGPDVTFHGGILLGTKPFVYFHSIVMEWNLIGERRKYLAHLCISLQMFGVLVGSGVAGYLGDRFGRKVRSRGHASAAHTRVGHIRLVSTRNGRIGPRDCPVSKLLSICVRTHSTGRCRWWHGHIVVRACHGNARATMAYGDIHRRLAVWHSTAGRVRHVYTSLEIVYGGSKYSRHSADYAQLFHARKSAMVGDDMCVRAYTRTGAWKRVITNGLLRSSYALRASIDGQ